MNVVLAFVLAIVLLLKSAVRLTLGTAKKLSLALHNDRWCSIDPRVCSHLVHLDEYAPPFPADFSATGVADVVWCGANVVESLVQHMEEDAPASDDFPAGATDGAVIELEDFPRLLAAFNTGDTTYLCIRGTESFIDALTDTTVQQRPLRASSPSVLVHSGFLSVWSSVWPHVASFPFKETVLVLGYSMGGGIAQVGAHLLQWKRPLLKVGCVAIAPPLTGNPEFARSIWDVLGGRLAILINLSDIIPFTPPSVLPSSSAGVTVWDRTWRAAHYAQWNYESLSQNHSVMNYARNVYMFSAL